MRRGELDVAALLAWLEVPSKQRGGERWARCPLHGELDPSFQIRDDGSEMAGVWRCFGCGESGNGPKLASMMLGISYADAIEMMEARGIYGEPPPTPEQVAIDIEQRSPNGGFRMPPGAVFGDLDTWTTPARRYALQRGITAAQVARWKIGVGIAGRLNGRIVIPVHDGAGVLRGYSARTYCDDPKRYDEPSVKDGYEPGFVWGESWWEHRKAVVVCEGALNGLAVERVLPLAIDTGVLPAVAAVRGSNLHPLHVMRLGSFERVIVASDPDAAGEKLWEALRGAFGRWADVRRVVLVGGDANKIEREEPAALACMLADAIL